MEVIGGYYRKLLYYYNILLLYYYNIILLLLHPQRTTQAPKEPPREPRSYQEPPPYSLAHSLIGNPPKLLNIQRIPKALWVATKGVYGVSVFFLIPPEIFSEKIRAFENPLVLLPSNEVTIERFLLTFNFTWQDFSWQLLRFML